MSTVSSPISALWSEYEAIIQAGWRLPDTEAARICLAAAAAHYSGADPVSLFIVGPPGSGKTSILINSLWALPETYLIGSITTKTLWSGCVGNRGVLQQLPETSGRSHGIFLFKDFTTMLSKRDQDAREIMAQLREVLDGYFSSRTGMGGDHLWQGKVTMFAACTYAIERAWSIRAELGERFLQVRMRTPLEGADWEQEGLLLADAAQAQAGGELALIDSMKMALKSFWEATPAIPSTPPMLDYDQTRYISKLAQFVTICRRNVHRSSGKGREIVDLDPPESPTRIAKGLSLIARWHAALFRKLTVDHQDLLVAQRVALDTIPWNRHRILFSLPTTGDKIGVSDVCRMARIPRGSIDYFASELELIELVSKTRDHIGQVSLNLTPNGTKLVTGSILNPETA